MKRIPCEVYSRVVGFLRPLRNWNKGKRQEERERRTFSWQKAVANETAHTQD